MRIDVAPTRTAVTPGQPIVVTASVFNTGDVIAAYRVDVLGVDARWVQTDVDSLQLFPGSSGTVVVTITLPPGIPAGTRTLGLQVTELTPPGQVELGEVELVVVPEAAAALAIEPVSITGGRSAELGVTVRNDGNTILDLELLAVDPEGKTRVEFVPPTVRLEPGETAAVSAKVSARRPIAGNVKMRQLTFTATGCEPAPQAFGTFLQRPLLPRGGLALLGLLAAVSVFALVITGALSKVVDQSAKDRDLLLDVIGRSEGDRVASGSVAGRVTQLSTGDPVSGVTVEAFAVDNPTVSVASAATTGAGAYQLDGLEEGTYKLRFRGAGFVEIWYPLALTQDEATEVEVAAGEEVTGIDVRLGGIPGSISGTVVGEDEPTGAVVTVRVPEDAGEPGGAEVASATVDATGQFLIEGIPSPSTYELELTKEGYGRSVVLVSLGAGEARRGLELVLRRGDGAVLGRVMGPDGPLGGVTVTATDGTTFAETVSLTQDDVGAFALRSLPTPSAYTLTFSKDGYTSASLQVGLGEAETRDGLQVTLRRGDGSISGRTLLDGAPTGGVSVTVTDGALTRATVSLSSGDVGAWRVSGLPVPGTYTVTFTRGDLQPQTRLVELDDRGRQHVGGVDVALRRATGSVTGAVREVGGAPIGGATVSLTSGDRTYRVRSADAGGRFEVAGVVPGTYTLTVTRSGSQPASRLITVAAGQVLDVGTIEVQPRASIRGQTLHAGNGSALAGVQVRLYLAAGYPNTLVATTQSNQSGGFSFPELEAPVTYIVEFYFPENTPRLSITVPLDGGEQRNLGAVMVPVG